MATKSDFTEREWELLLSVPAAVGTAVMYAGRSGLGSVAETMAMASGILSARHGYDGIELIESLIEARLKNGAKSKIETLKSPYRDLDDVEIIEDAVARCEDVAALLGEKSTVDEQDAYSTWTISVAEKVANAAKEGGFLGIGGQRVSEEEARVIAKVKRALQTK